MINQESSYSEQALIWINESITPLQKKAEWIQNHRPAFDAAPKPPTFTVDYIDFDNLTHEQVLQVIQLFGGTWEKKC